jgi:hypothetical protein
LVITTGAIALAACFLARADSYTFLGTLITVNNTTSNSAALAAGSFSMPSGVFLIQNAGLTATNALRVNIQVSVDNTNFVTVATYWPGATNATTERYSPSYSAQTIYLRAQAVTTNSVSVGLSYQY